ncbi:hypothetical protein K2X96_00345 [Patescibacteria group bacterium]|nr:hypothetical protein [Patescibacteria group bacterium]
MTRERLLRNSTSSLTALPAMIGALGMARGDTERLRTIGELIRRSELQGYEASILRGAIEQQIKRLELINKKLDRGFMNELICLGVMLTIQHISTKKPTKRPRYRHPRR